MKNPTWFLALALGLSCLSAAAAQRELVDAGPPFGKLQLVDEIDCGSARPGHEFTEYPSGVSRIERILDRPCRVAPMQADEASYISFRVGRGKQLKAGSAYLLLIEYPEDAPRSMVVMNGGCETSRGFHTGTTLGDALRPKYVWNNPESLDIPLARRYETWTQFFHLHDRFPERGFIRGAGPRTLTPPDGFPVTIAQFSLENDPPSRGIAVQRIRLIEVPDPRLLDVPAPRLPEGLPRRHIFYREEMADGVIDSDKPEQRGLAQPLDWYRHKASLMRFLGINTFSKDLLEFGACQHWDSTPGGGHNWVYYAERHKHLWEQIVELMGQNGFSILPYYEYAGSRGQKGIGHQRRAKPLKRDDAYTHISWIEQSNADITDPETHADFRKMLDLTVLRFKDKASFAGVWLRPRSQLPIGFADAALARFSQETNFTPVTRRQLAADKALLGRYYEWWFGKRREFLAAMRDHMRQSGVNPDAVVLFTADASEPGVSFPAWQRQLVTDDPAGTAAWLKSPDPKKAIVPLDIAEVISRKLYHNALLSAPLDWGNWEVSHASPAADPIRYRQTPGVMMTHGFNRAYTVALPETMDLFRTPAGLAMVRHYPLNENMMFDKAGKDLLGYFIADIERTGPYCMLAEARAVANGDPWHLGYLSGGCFNRGFPSHVRSFNSAFLTLPAMPSERLADAADDPDIVVRAIDAGQHGTWLAIVNTGLVGKPKVRIDLPADAPVRDAVTGQLIQTTGRSVTVPMEPCQLRALLLK